MLNPLKLKGKIIEKGYSISSLAEVMGVDKATLYRKMDDNGRTMLIKDADAIATTLNLTRDEVNDIFFSQYVADMR